MAPTMAATDKKIDMRHLGLKAEEAALLSGELTKPSWESRNEGIHERVSFEDTIWGFELAGGSYYQTPLRVVRVKPGSRAEKAGIRLGDKLKRINDIETSTLTIQEAHEIIIESGVHLKIAVTAPDDEEDAYYCYEDPLLEQGYDSDEERRRLEELERKRRVHAKVRSDWSLQWPWVSKRRVIWHESNCFMVPSKYEDKHSIEDEANWCLMSPKSEEKPIQLKSNREKFPPRDAFGKDDDIVLGKENIKDSANSITNGITNDATDSTIKERSDTTNAVPNGDKMTNGIDQNDNLVNGKNGSSNFNGDVDIPSEEEFGEVSQSSEMDSSQSEEIVSQEVQNHEESDISQSVEAPSQEVVSHEDTDISEVGILDEEEDQVKENGEFEEDSRINGVLSDSEEHALENSESMDER